MDVGILANPSTVWDVENISKTIKEDMCDITGIISQEKNIKCARCKKMSLFSCNVHYHLNEVFKVITFI